MDNTSDEPLHPDATIEERADRQHKHIHTAIVTLRAMIQQTGTSRAASLALTKLDEAEMWAKRALDE